MDTRIPLCDLKAQYASLRGELLPAVDEALASTAYIGGSYVQDFEAAFVRMHEASWGVGCASGTSAIRLALQALGVGPGDEVITTPHTFIATASAVFQVGATPVFADIDPRTYNIDPDDIVRRITPRTKAILPVHIFGNPCELDAIWRIAAAHGLRVIEDAAQAHFAKHQGEYVATRSDAGTFSFYPAKNLGAAGDGGFVFLRSKELADRVRTLANHGRTSDKYRHEVLGSNDRLDALQAVILGVKLRHIMAWSLRRAELALIYDASLRPRGFKTSEVLAGNECVYHQYVVEVDNRDEVMARLADRGIASQSHYAIPLHRQPALAGRGYESVSLPVTERVSRRVLSLPIYPEITGAQVERLLSEFLAFARP